MAPEDPDDDVPTDSDARKMSLVTVIAYGTTMGWSDIKPLEPCLSGSHPRRPPFVHSRGSCWRTE
jgi:hypothetical protein